MSAFVVSVDHINVLVAALSVREVADDALLDGVEYRRPGDPEYDTEIGRRLLKENMASVDHHYPHRADPEHNDQLLGMYRYTRATPRDRVTGELIPVTATSS